MEERFREEIQFIHWIGKLLFLLPVMIFIWVIVQTFIFDIPITAKPIETIVLLLLAFLFAFILLLFGRMVITVNEGEVIISFGYLGWIKKRIPISDIERAEVVSYKPLRQFGGWGIRTGRFHGEKVGCYTIKGNTGVLITLSKLTRFCISRLNKLIIGSLMPDKLVKAIGKGMKIGS